MIAENVSNRRAIGLSHNASIRHYRYLLDVLTLTNRTKATTRNTNDSRSPHGFVDGHARDEPGGCPFLVST